MFCPECSAEYREGFARCSDCDVPLVAALPPEETDAIRGSEEATVFVTRDMVEAETVKDAPVGEVGVTGEEGGIHVAGCGVAPAVQVRVTCPVYPFCAVTAPLKVAVWVGKMVCGELENVI